MSEHARRTSTVHYTGRTEIDQPVEQVFARLTDLAGYRDWMHRTGLFRSCRQESDGPLRSGSRYVDSTWMGTFHGDVILFEPPSVVAFQETLRWLGTDIMQARPRYRLEPNGAATIVHHVAEGELFGWARAMKPMAALMARMERARTIRSLARSFRTANTATHPPDVRDRPSRSAP